LGRCMIWAIRARLAPQPGDAGVVHESVKVDHLQELDDECHQGDPGNAPNQVGAAARRTARRIQAGKGGGIAPIECRRANVTLLRSLSEPVDSFENARRSPHTTKDFVVSPQGFSGQHRRPRLRAFSSLVVPPPQGAHERFYEQTLFCGPSYSAR